MVERSTLSQSVSASCCSCPCFITSGSFWRFGSPQSFFCCFLNVCRSNKCLPIPAKSSNRKFTQYMLLSSGVNCSSKHRWATGLSMVRRFAFFLALVGCTVSTDAKMKRKSAARISVSSGPFSTLVIVRRLLLYQGRGPPRIRLCSRRSRADVCTNRDLQSS